MSETLKHLEADVHRIVCDSISDAIKARLAQGYSDSPLNKIVDQVVISRAESLRKLVESSIDGALCGDFKKELEDAVKQKLARILVSKIEGEIEKRANELRASPDIRAKMTIAVKQAIESTI